MTFDRLSMVHIAAVLSWTLLAGCYDLTPVPAADAGACPTDMVLAYGGCGPETDPDADNVDAAVDDGPSEPTE
jgi:hypothetical protein